MMSLFVIITLLLVTVYQKQCMGLSSWTMTNECGAGISHDEYAGELVFDTDITPLYIPRCTVTITPKLLNEHVPNRIMFYFTEYMMGQECLRTNLTIRDGTSIHDAGVEGLPQHLCSYTPVETNKVYNTLTSSLTVVYTMDTFGGTASSRFVIKYLVYHTGNCSQTSEHECNNERCIPSAYYCSQDINVCSETDEECSHENSDQDTPITSIFTSIGVICMIVIILCACKEFLKKLKDSIGEICGYCANCFSDARTKCRGCNHSMHRLCIRIRRVFHFIRHTCKKNTNNTPTRDENNSGETTVQNSNRNVPDIRLDSPVIRRPPVLIDILDDITHPSAAHVSPTAPPPDYDDLFSPAPISDSPVDVESIPDITNRLQTENGIVRSLEVRTSVLNSESNVTDSAPDSSVFQQPQVLGTLDDAIHSSDEQIFSLVSPPDYVDAISPDPVSDSPDEVESTPNMIRRLQTEYGFEHPFDFETDFDYYYSTDSDWETDSDSTSTSGNELAPSQRTVDIENPRTDETHSIVCDNMMPRSNGALVENNSAPLQTGRGFASSDINNTYGTDEITPSSVTASETVPPELPPPYDDEDNRLPPNYYDYIANVSLYKH